jgi:hypothetical protein
MNIPIPPTDNLYKFAALSGTVIFILSIYLPMEYINKLDARTEAYKMKLFALTAEIKLNEARVSKLESIGKNENKITAKDKNKLNIVYTDSDIKELDRQIDELNMSITTKRLESNYYSTTLSEALERFKFDKIFIDAIAFSSIFIAFSGYYFWYHRIQKYQDIAIKEEAYKNR